MTIVLTTSVIRFQQLYLIVTMTQKKPHESCRGRLSHHHTNAIFFSLSTNHDYIGRLSLLTVGLNYERIPWNIYMKASF